MRNEGPPPRTKRGGGRRNGACETRATPAFQTGRGVARAYASTASLARAHCCMHAAGAWALIGAMADGAMALAALIVPVLPAGGCLLAACRLLHAFPLSDELKHRHRGTGHRVGAPLATGCYCACSEQVTLQFLKPQPSRQFLRQLAVAAARKNGFASARRMSCWSLISAQRSRAWSECTRKFLRLSIRGEQATSVLLDHPTALRT
jgi:hypothetical protein